MTEFERFFEQEFPKLLAAVKSEPGILSTGHGIEASSWDRKAAYLLWIELSKQPRQAEEIEGLLV